MKRTVKLIGIRSELEWQLAFQASKEAEKGRRNYLTYGTPHGDITMTVEQRGNEITIRSNRHV